MKLLLDSANLSEIERFSKSISTHGVTTNPSLVAKESKTSYESLLLEIADKLDTRKHLSVEVTTLDPDEMLLQAAKLHGLLSKYVDLYIKIPVMPETMRVIHTLSNGFIRVNATACMTALQAKMAADAGAHIVSFFYNRMKDYHKDRSSGDASRLAQNELAKFYSWNQSAGTHAPKVICGSIRKDTDIEECFDAGVDYVTTSASILDSILRHPKTVESIQGFQKDIDAWLL